MSTSIPAWRTALERLLNAPSLSPQQARFLFSQLGVPRAEVVTALLERLSDPVPQRVKDAAFVLETVVTGEDKPTIRAFVDGSLPLKIRAMARSLYQNGILHDRLTDAEADLPPPPSETLAFQLEDAARQVARIPSPWQRARVAAETLVGDVPLPDESGVEMVTRLAERVDVDPAAIWAELRIHPLTRPAFRAAAEAALKTPSHAAGTMFGLAAPVLLAGELRTIAEAETRRHQSAPPAAWQARLSAPDGRAGFAAVFFVDGPVPKAFSASLSSEAQGTQAIAGEGAAAENALAAGFRYADPRDGLLRVPLEFALGLVRQVCGWLNTNPKRPDVYFTTAKEWVAKVEQLSGVKPVLPVLPAPSAVDLAALKHPLVRSVELVASDLPEKSRGEVGKEMRLFGRPREETLSGIAMDIAKKGATPSRLVRGFELAAHLANIQSDAAAPVFAAFAQTLQKPAEPAAQKILKTMLLMALESVPPAEGPMTSRDELRDEVIPDNPEGKHVLALDLGAAGLDAAIRHGRVLESMDDDVVIQLHAESGKLASMAVLVKDSPVPEEARLQEAAKQAILHIASTLPSRQRRDLQDLWVKGWQDLLATACRGSCTQQCPANMNVPRPFGAYSIDHPRLNKAWPE